MTKILSGLKTKTEKEYYTLPEKVIGNELFVLQRDLKNFYESVKQGNDVDMSRFAKLKELMNVVEKSIKVTKPSVTKLIFEGETREHIKAATKFVIEQFGYNIKIQQQGTTMVVNIKGVEETKSWIENLNNTFWKENPELKGKAGFSYYGV